MQSVKTSFNDSLDFLCKKSFEKLLEIKKFDMFKYCLKVSIA